MGQQTPASDAPSAEEVRQQRRAELRRLMRRLERRAAELQSEPSRATVGANPGISVIVPTFQGRAHLGACLESLVAQTIDRSLFEVIVVLNGPPDGSREIVEALAEQHGDVEWRIVELLDRPGVGRARNAGIDLATRELIAFVDDDDEVSPRYLEALYAHASWDVVPMAWLDDVHQDGTDTDETPVNRVISQFQGRTISAAEAPSLLSLNACKLLPTVLVRRTRYNTRLRSGVDVDFLTRLYAAGRFQIHALTRDEGAIYRRTVRPGSVSRQKHDFDFAVEGRLDVIEHISAHAVSPHPDVARVTRAMIWGQAGFINRYLDSWPNERPRVVDAVDARALPWFAWPALNGGRARRLAISYCFVPYAGTSSIVAAKRIRAAEVIVDVLYNAMDSVRELDESTRVIASPFIDRETVLATPTLFGAWRAIDAFCVEGWTAIEQAEATKGPYESVWSRAMWPASHALAGLLAVRRPGTPWIAEFSDPLSRNVRGERRTGRIGEGPIAAELLSALAAAGHPAAVDATLFELCEQLAYVFATELHFTNVNQLEYMLDYCPAGLRQLVRDKARLMPQPTLPPRFYSLANVDSHPLPSDQVNVGYFGAFYANRGIGEVLDGIEQLTEQERRLLRLHVFTSDPEALRLSLEGRPAASCVQVAGYRPYLEFLALAARMDALLVNDAATAGSEHEVNPYLPSKYSDYKGSGTAVWGHVEPGSPLSHEKLDQVSLVGDVSSVVGVLRALIEGTGLSAAQTLRSSAGAQPAS